MEDGIHVAVFRWNVSNVLVVQHNLTGINRFQTGNQAKNGCFTAARGAKQRKNSPLLMVRSSWKSPLCHQNFCEFPLIAPVEEANAVVYSIFYSVPCKRNGWLTDAGFVVNHLDDS
ncbi:hypothetical protein ACNKHK_07220 [Shigella flexneri]